MNIIGISSSNPLPISLGGTGNTSGSPTGIAGGDLTGSYPNPTVATNAITYAKLQQVSANKLLGNPTGSLANSQEISLGSTLSFSGTSIQTSAMTGDITSSANSFLTTLATVNSNVGTFGSSTQVGSFTVNAKGLITSASNITISGVLPGGLSGGDLSGNYPNPTVAKINTVPVTSSTVTDGQILIGSTSGSNYTASTLTGTANQVNVANGSHSITLSLPQSIATSSSPTFTGLTLSGITPNQAIVTNGTSVLSPLAYASTNTASSLVQRDSSGNFSAGTITATLSGTATNANNILTAQGTSNTTYYIGYFPANSASNQVPQVGADFTVNPGLGILGANNINVGGGVASIISPLTVAYNGSLAAGHIAYFGSFVAATAANFYSITIDKSGIDSLIMGVNKNTTTGNIPANSTFITTFQTNGSISLGRGGANGQPNAYDILIDSSGNLNINNFINAGSSALTGTTKYLSFSGSLAAGNYINVGTNGRNIGVFSGGNLFFTFGLDFNVAGTDYLYNSGGSAPGAALEITTSGGFNFRTAPSGTSGSAATMTNVMSINNAGGVTLLNGSLDISTIGQGLKVAEGTNAKQGTSTLAAGTVTVANTSVTATSRIFLTAQNTSGTAGSIYVSARTAGTSFTITSTSALDTRLIAWEIFEVG